MTTEITTGGPSGADTEADSGAAATPTRRRGPSPTVVFAIASLGAAVAFVDATIVNIAFPNIERSFPGTSLSTLSWVLSAYNIVFAAFLVAFGRLADLLGRRRIFLAGLEVFTVASLLCAVAPSPGALIAFRIVQAFGGAMLVPTSLALVLNAFPPERRSHGVALLSAIAAVAAGLGPSLGGLLVSVDDWRLVFLVNIPIGVAGVILGRRCLVENRAAGRRRMPDLAGAALFALSIATLVLAVVEGQDWGWTSVPILASFLAAVLLGVAFVWRCSWHRAPLIDLSLLRIRSFTVANAMTTVAAAGFYGYTLTNVLFLTGVWRYSVLEAGLAMTPGPFVAAAVAGPTSRVALRIGHRPVLVAGGLIWGAGVLWFVKRVGVQPDFLGEWLPGMVLAGVGAGTLFPNISAAAVGSAPGEDFATATGLNSVARQVGAALGVALVVAIIGTPTALTAAAAFRDAWTFGSACLFAAGLGCLLVGRIEVSKTPALGDAARLVQHPADANATPAQPRARRAFTVNAPEGSTHRAESVADFLALVPLFAELDPSLLDQLSASARGVRIAAGEWLFHEGEPGAAMYVVRAGRLEVFDETAGARVVELGRGDVVGELALLTDAPRAASVRALRASELLAIDKVEFERTLLASPQLSLALNRSLASQLRESRPAAPGARSLPATVAIVELGEGAPGAAFAEHLATAAGPDCVLLRDPLAAADAQDAVARYAPLLDRAEGDHELVLLAAGAVSAPTPWTDFCLQQADRILALSRGGPVDEAARQRLELRGCDLVACDVMPGSGELRPWAELLSPIESHVFREAEAEADIGRIARRLSGRSVGVVLSGGGARGFSHIGVLEELLAAGILIDRVAGVSMGAFIGALFAMGLDIDEIDARCFEEWVQRRPLGDYTVPRRSLIRGERAKAMLHRCFGERAIEELPLSFMCGFTELRSGSLVLARYGSLWENVAYSINLPIIGPPQVRGRELLVDGALVDNLPVEAMANMGEGPIIAVDVRMTLGGGTGAPRSKGSSVARAPSLGETVARVLLLASSNTSDAARRHADLIIKPRAEGVGLLEFHQLDAAREAGRLAAREALARAPSTLFG